jgi:hypothetical protein
VTASTGSAVDLSRVLAEIEQRLVDARQLAHDIAAGVDAVLSLVPHAVAAIGHTIGAFVRQVEAYIWALGELLAAGGSPSALRAAGAAWTTEVGAVTSALAGDTSIDVSLVDDRWTGVAADAYRNTLLPQQQALAAIKATTDEIDSGLQEFAGALRSFWVSMLGAAVSLCAALAVALGQIAGVLTAPVGAAAGIGAIGAFGKFVADATADFVTLSSSAAARSAEVTRRLTTNSAFRSGGRWPRSTTDLTDASITDGDDTDWHLR